MPHLLLGEHVIELVDSHKHFDMWLTPALHWTRHINELITKCSRTIEFLENLNIDGIGKFRKFVTKVSLEQFWNMEIFCMIPVWKLTARN